MRWRLVMAGLTVCAMAVAQPVSVRAEAPTRDDVSAFEDSGGSGGSSDTWATVGWGALTGLSNLLYVPAKLAYASLGGLTGGLALGLTGGDMNTAQAIWEPSLGGDYFLTPQMVQGEDSISFAGAPSQISAPPPDEAPPNRAPDDPHFGS